MKSVKLSLQYIYLYIRHIFAENSVRIFLINLLNKDTRSATITERMDTDPVCLH